MIRTLIILACLAAAAPAFATGRLTCEPVARDAWLSKDALTAKLTEAGWQVRFMKEDGGCWEVYGTTPEGKRVEAYFHPASGEQLLLLQRGQVIWSSESLSN